MDFATQLNVSLANGWGIVRMIADKALKMPEGKYLLIKDPNKVRIQPLFSMDVATDETVTSGCYPLVLGPCDRPFGRRGRRCY